MVYTCVHEYEYTCVYLCLKPPLEIRGAVLDSLARVLETSDNQASREKLRLLSATLSAHWDMPSRVAASHASTSGNSAPAPAPVHSSSEMNAGSFNPEGGDDLAATFGPGSLRSGLLSAGQVAAADTRVVPTSAFGRPDVLATAGSSGRHQKELALAVCSFHLWYQDSHHAGSSSGACIILSAISRKSDRIALLVKMHCGSRCAQLQAPAC